MDEVVMFLKEMATSLIVFGCMGFGVLLSCAVQLGRIAKAMEKKL